jgi:hypothetical protein
MLPCIGNKDKYAALYTTVWLFNLPQEIKAMCRKLDVCSVLEELLTTEQRGFVTSLDDPEARFRATNALGVKPLAHQKHESCSAQAQCSILALLKTRRVPRPTATVERCEDCAFDENEG